MYRVGVKIGHTENAKGAYSPKLEMSEWDYNLKVGKELIALNDEQIQFEVFTFDKSIGSYTKRQKALADIMNKKKFDAVIELHFNSAESQKAKGICSLYFHTSKKGKELARIVGDQLFKDFGTERDPDMPMSSPTQNGYEAVAQPIPVAILIEPFFGSNPLEAVLFKGKDGMIKYAKSIKAGLLKYFLSLT
jgi:N-acetylmuramoyl-L-alanine amidase